MEAANSLMAKAQVKLSKAYKDASTKESPICKHHSLIDYVLDGNHLTYKYVLINALLSKAIDGSLNPLCLQKQSELPGAYDARTICHKVFVPFEQTVLKKALGGSNEPFLNKPARYPELNKENAVRRGADQRMLFRLCDELPTIDSSADAYDDLVYMLSRLIVLRDNNESLGVFSIPESVNLPIMLSRFANNALQQNYEGEVLTLVISGLYHLLLRNENALVDVHPVNESGASSKEISDLDIYVDGSLVVSNELKDKEFSESDVRHAADKVISAGGNKMFFIIGYHGNPITNDFCNKLIDEYDSRNFMLVIIPCAAFIRMIIPLISNVDCHEYVKFILETAHETKFKEEVISYFDILAQKEFGLQR